MKWINIKDKLPENGEWVLVLYHPWIGMQEKHKIEWQDFSESYYCIRECESMQNCNHFEISHWMRIEFPTQRSPRDLNA